MSNQPKSRLSLYIVISIIVAIAVALFAPSIAVKFHLGGEMFLSLLKMLVIPLVMASVMSGVIGLGDIRKLGKPGLVAVIYYCSTTLLAVITGLLMVNLLSPGVDSIDPQRIAEIGSMATGESHQDANIGTILNNLALMLVTDNLFESAVKGELLPLIIFSIAFAGMLTTMGEKVKTLTDIIVQVNEALLSFILLLMKIAPFGIFCLVTARFGEAQLEGKFIDELSQTAQYVLTVISALAIHALITIPAILWWFTRRNPWTYITDMSQALLTAFSTASSSATLPVTIESAVKNAGVSKKSAEFVLPLGATINMDGTALYEAVAAIFIAQALGIDLSFGQQIIIAFTATLAAIGAAGIPEAGLVTMLIVLNSVGLPTEYISLILAVDWLLDRFRTTVNVFGDAAGAAIVEKSFAKNSTDIDSV